MDADYVIVGAGTAGCVLAARLSADPAVRVVLVEAGGANRHPLLRVPKGFYLTMRRPEFVWHYATDAGEWWLRGRGLGGSTAVNGMMYVRGCEPDYDALGAPDWSWPHVLAAFREMEDHALGGGRLRGVGGPLPIDVPSVSDPVSLAVREAAARTGLDVVDDVNAHDHDRIGPVPSTIRRGRRVDAASAFLRPVLDRPNLAVLTGAPAERVLVEGGRAVGVLVRRGERRRVVRARREVVLAAGTIESPLLLERSGIGHPDVLRSAGITPLVDSPRVGEGLIEHRGVTLQLRLHPGLGLNRRLGTPIRQVVAGAGYLLRGGGPIATGPYDLVGQFRSAADAPRPDVQLLATPMSVEESADRLRLADYPGLTLQGYPLRPETAGSVHLPPAGAGTAPRITARWLESDADRRVTGRILDRLRDLAATGPLGELVVHEQSPGERVRTADEVVRYARERGSGIYHAVGSCALGPDQADVVDLQLRVRGVAGLRVVDASVFPRMPSGNTAAPVMALAWRAADVLVAGTP